VRRAGAGRREPLRLRPAQEGDRQTLWHIHSRSVRELCRSAYSAREIATWVALLRPERYLRPGYVVLLAERARHAVGFTQFDPGTGELAALYVLPEEAGRRVGSQLLETVEGLAREAQVRRIYLDASLNAEGFYLAHGYTTVHPTVRILTPEVQLACIRMEKWLSASRRPPP
jgi:GNAT superfamily N-acetyltransferase